MVKFPKNGVRILVFLTEVNFNSINATPFIKERASRLNNGSAEV